MNTNEKLQKLRKSMQEAGIDAYDIPTADPHMSEYVTPHYQTRAWLTGFTGSQGQALVFPDEAKVWADGRYYIQAANEIAGSEFALMKMGTPGVPTVLEYLRTHLAPHQTVAADGRCLSRNEQERIEEVLSKIDAKLELHVDLVGDIWENRPALPHAEAFLLDERYTGRSTRDKLSALRRAMVEEGQDYHLLGKLDDIAWLFNVRGGDVKHTPVMLAYARISAQEAIFFVDETKIAPDVRKSLEEDGIEIRPYEEIMEAFADVEEAVIRLDTRYINAAVYASIPASNKIVATADWTSLQKAIKNETEIQQQKEAYIKDGVAVTRMIHWLKTTDVSCLDELTVSETLFGYRQELEDFIEESFTTISAYGKNAPMMHYAPTKEKQAKLEKKSFLLVDSGGQYLEGTTDTTRTIALGDLTEEEVRDYTLCLKGHINLARAVFLDGTTGQMLDVLARQPLWENHIDYKSGTGHGVGYLLSVHEGPHSISKANITQKLIPGMVVTNEPGVYKTDKHGIRLENVYVVVEDALVDTDRFLKFENFTRVPFEREAIDVGLLTDAELDWLNTYHQSVYETLAPRVEENVRVWLAEVCAPMHK